MSQSSSPEAPSQPLLTLRFMEDYQPSLQAHTFLATPLCHSFIFQILLLAPQFPYSLLFLNPCHSLGMASSILLSPPFTPE